MRVNTRGITLESRPKNVIGEKTLFIILTNTSNMADLCFQIVPTEITVTIILKSTKLSYALN